MPRERSPNRDKAFEIYKEHGGDIDLAGIAEQLGLPAGTIRGWKNKDKWDERLNGTFQTDTERSKPRGAPPGNKNAAGHGAPARNKNAEKHGFFTKYLPPETLEIMQAIESKSPLDMLWDQIMIQYTAIIRAQQIMYVRDREDMTKEQTLSGDTSDAWEVQQAWDKQANFLQAQSKAMTALNGMIKQYEDMLKKDLATEEQRARIDKLKAETGRLTGEGLDTEDLSDIEGEIYGS